MQLYLSKTIYWHVLNDDYYLKGNNCVTRPESSQNASQCRYFAVVMPWALPLETVLDSENNLFVLKQLVQYWMYVSDNLSFAIDEVCLSLPHYVLHSIKMNIYSQLWASTWWDISLIWSYFSRFKFSEQILVMCYVCYLLSTIACYGETFCKGSW